MSSGALRRRVHHEDVGGGRYDRVAAEESDGLNEPLLGTSDFYEQKSRQAYYVSWSLSFCSSFSPSWASRLLIALFTRSNCRMRMPQDSGIVYC